MVDFQPPPGGVPTTVTATVHQDEDEEPVTATVAFHSPSMSPSSRVHHRRDVPDVQELPMSPAAGGRSMTQRTLPTLRNVVGGTSCRSERSSPSHAHYSPQHQASPSSSVKTSSYHQHHPTAHHHHHHHHSPRQLPSIPAGSHSATVDPPGAERLCSTTHPADSPRQLRNIPAFADSPMEGSTSSLPESSLLAVPSSSSNQGGAAPSPSSSSSSSSHQAAPGAAPSHRAHRSSRHRRHGSPPIPAHVPLDESYPLHDAVFHGDVRRVAHLLRTNQVPVGSKDIHGNTALHIAVSMGRKDCIHLLLAHNSPIKLKNTQGWSSLSEAVSYGDRQTILCLLRKLKNQSRDSLEARRPDLIQALNDMGDFYMELKWDFQSWVPFLSRILPSDVCKIHKRGSSMRLDTTLVDFSDMRWERGDLTFLFNGRAKPTNSLVVMDNQLKVYQMVRYEETEAELEDEVDILMSSDIVAVQMSTKAITLERAQSGWLFRKDRAESIGPFQAEVYSVHGMVVDSKKRREHLTDEDLQKNKAMFESFSKGRDMTDNFDGQPPRRPNLEKPPPTKVTWEEYINAPTGKPPYLGRPIVCKNQNKSFKAYLAISQDFPIDFTRLLDVLEVVAPFKHFNKLREFVEMKLPPGFPVQIEVPIFPTIVAKVTFQEFKVMPAEESDVTAALFEIPSDYKEDPNRFPDL